MDRYDITIINGIVVTDTEVREYDIAIKNGKTEQVKPRGKLQLDAERCIDAQGGYVMVSHVG